MTWIDDLMEVPSRTLCTFTGGHTFSREGRLLVCTYCGKVIRP